MRKTILIAVMMLLNVLVMAGQETTIEGIKYYVDHNGAVGVQGVETTSDVTILERVNIAGVEYKVGFISYEAFKGNHSLERIHIPNSIRGFYKYAFYECSSLKEITIPNSATGIDEYVFGYCSSLEKITIPNSVIRIWGCAFIGCTSLKEIIIPNSVKEIHGAAFCECSSLKEIIIPNSVKEIHGAAFRKCSSLEKIVIPNTIKDIGNWTFEECISLKEITIPNSVTRIGKEAFSACRDLKEITLSGSLISIEENAFEECLSLERISIPESVTSIAYHAFKGCKNLKEVVFASVSQKNKFARCFPTTVKLTVNENALAQNSFTPSAPPSIDFVANSLQFVDANGNNAIDAEEKCTIRLQVTNSGKGDARNCVAKITSATIPGVTYKNVDIPQIKAGETKTVEIPLTVNLQTQNGTAKFTIQVNEPNGFGTDAVSLSVNTRAFDAPMLKVVDYATVSADGSSVLAKKSAFDLQILLQNVEVGKAENVQVSIEVPNNVFLMDTQNQKTFTSIDGGDTKKITYSLIANNNYAGSSIPVKVNVKEKHGKYAESRTIDLPLNQTLRNHNIVLEERSGDGQKKDIQIASIGSDVDKNIPSSTVKNDRTFAVIIANENYNKEANVPYAVNDGSVFSEYCLTTLGVPTNNIHLVRNATLNDIRHEVNWITNVMDASGGKAKVLFYYAGHGIPDEKTRTAYLLPVDGYGSDVTTGYPLATLYSVLGETPSQSVTVFLDACFSGTKREGDMMASARGVAIKVNETSPVGNMVVFSAAQGDETAYPYTEQGHGLFTYYLLKKLQDTAGDVTLGDLSDYVIEQVKLQSVVINSKPQTPSVIPSPNMSSSWRSETLK